MKQKNKYYIIYGIIFFCVFMMITLLLAIVGPGDLNGPRVYAQGAITTLIVSFGVWGFYKYQMGGKKPFQFQKYKNK